MNKTSQEILAIKLKYYRHINKIFQENFTYQIGSSLNYINQIENQKRNVSIDMIDKIGTLTYSKEHIVKFNRIDQKSNSNRN